MDSRQCHKRFLGAWLPQLLVLAIGCGGDSGGTPSRPGDSVPDPPSTMGEGSWIELARLPIPVISGAAMAYRGRIYVTGGWESADPPPTAAVQRYDPVTDEWVLLNELPRPIARHTMAVFRDTLLVIGGNLADGSRVSYDPTDEIHAYDPDTDSWSLWGRLPRRLTSTIQATEANGKLLIVGGKGLDGRQPPGDSIMIFEDAESWRHLAPPTDDPRISAVMDGRVWVFTDDAARGPLFELDVATGSFVRSQHEPWWRGSGGVVAGGRLHLFNLLSTAEQNTFASPHRAFVPGQTSWTVLPNPGRRLVGGMVAAIGDRVYALGGLGPELEATSAVSVYAPPS